MLETHCPQTMREPANGVGLNLSHRARLHGQGPYPQSSGKRSRRGPDLTCILKVSPTMQGREEPGGCRGQSQKIGCIGRRLREGERDGETRGYLRRTAWLREHVIEFGALGCKQHPVYSFEGRTTDVPFAFSSPPTGREV